MAEAEQDFSQLPLTERLIHKQWKARLGAYENLIEVIKKADRESDHPTEELKKYQEYVRKMVVDSNAVAQEKALQTALEYFRVVDEPFGLKMRGQIVSSLIEKCLGSAKAGTKKKSIELLLLFVEFGSTDSLIDEIVGGLSMKQPKIVVSCLETLTDIVRQFGVKVIPVKTILKAIPAVFGHSDKDVRANGSNLVVELFRWLRHGIDPFLTDLKKIQQDELSALFESVPSTVPSPERFLLSQKAAMAAPSTADVSTVAGAAEEEEVADAVDSYDLMDPIDISAKIPNNFYNDLASSKWKERKEALDGLLVVVSTPKITDSRLHELIGALAKRLADANILVVVTAANCIEKLACGLRSAFAQYRSIVISPIIEKCKEKKSNVVEALRGALDGVFVSATLQDIHEDIVTATNHKNPQVKNESIQWLLRCLRKTKKEISKSVIKPLVEALVKACDDSDTNVRDSAAEAIGTFMKLCGERTIGGYIDKMEPIKQGKVRDFCEKCDLKPIASTVKAAVPSSGSTKVLKRKVVKPSNVDDDLLDIDLQPPVKKATERKPISSGIVKKTGNRPSSTSSSASSVKKTISAPPAVKKEKEEKDDRIEGKSTVSDVEALEKLTATFSMETVKGLHDANWKTRLSAIENICQSLTSGSDVNAEAVTASLANLPVWKDPNVLVQVKLCNVLQALSTRPSFTKQAAAIAIDGLLEKLGDAKVGNSARECLHSFADAVTLGFVFSQAYEPLSKQKSPKILASALQWMESDLLQFGTANGLKVKALNDFIRVCLSSTNTVIRTSAVSLFGALGRFSNPSSRAFFDDQVSPLVKCLEDRNPDIRKTAQSCFMSLAKSAGVPNMRKLCELNLSPATLQSVLLVLDKCPRDSKPVSAAPGVTIPQNAAGGLVSATSANGSHVKPTLSKIRLPSQSSLVEDEFLEGGIPPRKKEFSLDLDQLNLPKISHNLATQDPRSFGMNQSESLPEVLSIEHVIELIPNPSHCIDALLGLEKIVGSNPASIVSHVDELVKQITLQTRVNFSLLKDSALKDPKSPSSTRTARLCKYLIRGLYTIFCQKQLAQALSERHLHGLLHDLVEIEINNALAAIEPTQTQSKVDLLISRILENCNRNCSYSVLLVILETSSSELKTISDTNHPAVKFTDLVMKGLWRLRKVLASDVAKGSIKVEKLLLDIHNFLVAAPPKEWKLRVSGPHPVPLKDLPLRTVRILLDDLVKALGETVFTYLSEASDERSSIYHYLRHMLDEMKKKNNPPATTAVPSHREESSVSSAESTSKAAPILTHSANLTQPTSIGPSVDDIFKQLSSKQGMMVLYKFRKNYSHREHEIERKLSTCSAYLSNYIKQQLAQIEQEENSKSNPPVEPPTHLKSAVGGLVSAATSHEVSEASGPAPDADCDGYRRKLSTLQKMYGGLATVAPDENKEPLVENVSNLGVVSGATAASHIMASTERTVATLKEQLARIRDGVPH